MATPAKREALALLTFSTSDFGGPDASPAKKAPACDPRLVLARFRSAPVLDFGDVPVGTTVTRSVTLDNPRDAGAVVALDVATKTAGLIVQFVSVAVPPASSESVDITWTPTAAGGVRETIQLSLDGRRGLALRVLGNGVGVAAKPAARKRSSRKLSEASPAATSVVVRSSRRAPKSLRQVLASRAPTRPSATAAADAAPSCGRAPKRAASSRRPRRGSARRGALYDSEWQARQEQGFSRWLNFVLTGRRFGASSSTGDGGDDSDGEEDCLVGIAAAGGARRLSQAHALAMLVRKRQQAELRRRAVRLYHSDEMDELVYAVDREVSRGGLAIRADRPLHADLGKQGELWRVLASYKPEWLQLGLETVVGQLVPLPDDTSVRSKAGVAALRKFVVDRLCVDEGVADKFRATVAGVHCKEHTAEQHRHSLQRILMLLAFLDRCVGRRGRGWAGRELQPTPGDRAPPLGSLDSSRGTPHPAAEPRRQTCSPTRRACFAAALRTRHPTRFFSPSRAASWPAKATWPATSATWATSCGTSRRPWTSSTSPSPTWRWTCATVFVWPAAWR